MVMMKNRLTPVLLVLALMLAGVGNVLTYERNIQAVGKLKKIRVEVYSDPNCTVVVDSISWGYVVPNSTNSYICYVKNIGNHRLTLFMGTSDWLPTNVTQYMSCDWNATGVEIAKREVVKVEFVLTLLPFDPYTLAEDFSFLITVGAYG